MYAFVDRERHYYMVVGSFTIHKAPSIQIVLHPPRMEERYVQQHPLFTKIVESFLKAATTYGGDPIAVNLLKEHYIMAANPIFLIRKSAIVTALLVAAIVGTAKKALELTTADPDLTAVKTKEEFEALPENLRLLAADLDDKVATLDNASKLERAFEVLGKYTMPAAVKPAKAKGVKSLIRDLMAVEGAKHTVAEIVTLTGGTEVSVKTALSDLRSPTYCKPGEPLDIARLPSGHYCIMSKEAVAAEKQKLIDAKAESKKAADEKKAADKAAKDAEKAAKAAAAPADGAEAKPAKKGKKAAVVAPADGGVAGGEAAAS